jgi:hypothetical protein
MRVAQQMGQLNQEYDQITRSLPSAGVGGSTMRDSVAFYNSSIRGFPRITDFAVDLSHVLDRHPEMRLEQLAWMASDDAKAMPPMRRIPPAESVPVTTLKTAESSQAKPADTSVFAGGRYEVALVEGTVHVATNDFRDALADVRRLADEIAALPGTTAEVVESPLDTRSSVAILGKHGGSEPQAMQPGFVLRVVRDHGGQG